MLRKWGFSCSRTLALCAVGAVLFLLLASKASAQTNSGIIEGTVTDPSKAVVPGAKVHVENPVSGHTADATTGPDGKFVIANLPLNPYHLTVTSAGFTTFVQDVDVKSTVPVMLDISLTLGSAATSITVTENAEDLVEVTPTDHTDIDRGLFERLPLESQSSSLSSLVTLASPGIAADSNGLFHGLGDHASNSFSIDGQPITDQQSKVFSNQVPTDAIQSLEVIEGAPPAEYGDKTSVVIVATTRSGLGITQPTGSVTASYGSFGTTNEAFDVAYGNQKVGDFFSVNGLNTSRFLDGPEYEVFHDHGNEENVFDRFDFKPTEKDALSVDLGYTRSWFQTPNSYDAEDATAWSGPLCTSGLFDYSTTCNGLGPNGQPVGPTDQRSQIGTFNIGPSWTHTINSNMVSILGVWVRRDQYNYYPSSDPFADLIPDLQQQTIAQNRRLTNLGARASLSYVKGIHNLKGGINVENTLLTENDSFGIIDPTLNSVCNNADGSADLDPSLTDPAACTGTLTANPNFNPLLACYDLTRTGPLPASDGCPTSTSGLYTFNGHADIRETALYLEDSISFRNWNFNLGLRGDFYDGITRANQANPRIGIAYNIKKTGSVLRLSYARTMETPFNENLILASEGCSDPVVNAIMSSTISPCVTTTPLSPGIRNEFHAGLQQAFGKYFVLDGEYIWKYTDRAFDFSVLGDSPITFPIEWTKSNIPGFAVRGSMPNFHGFSAFIVMSDVAARFFEPQESGIGAAPTCSPTTGCEVFRIDHDEIFNQTTHLQYQPWKRGPWIALNWRYDSGLVAGPVPCAGGNCANGPAGSSSVVDTSIITPDQQFQAGLFCGSVYATPTTPISSSLGTNLCPASQYGSLYVSIPAPGTENDDRNPPRVAQRNLLDASINEDNLFNGDHYRWSLGFTVINMTNKEALYNFISTFSGTHYVSPRTETIQLGFHF